MIIFTLLTTFTSFDHTYLIDLVLPSTLPYWTKWVYFHIMTTPTIMILFTIDHTYITHNWPLLHYISFKNHSSYTIFFLFSHDPLSTPPHLPRLLRPLPSDPWSPSPTLWPLAAVSPGLGAESRSFQGCHSDIEVTFERRSHGFCPYDGDILRFKAAFEDTSGLVEGFGGKVRV